MNIHVFRKSWLFIGIKWFTVKVHCICIYVWRERERELIAVLLQLLMKLWQILLQYRQLLTRNYKIKLFYFLWFCSLNSNYIAHSIVIMIHLLAIIFFLQWQFVICSCDELNVLTVSERLTETDEWNKILMIFMCAYYVC